MSPILRSSKMPKKRPSILVDSVPAENRWISQIFNTHAARHGGIVRRKVSAVEKFAKESRLRACVKLRGFHMYQFGDHYVIVCTKKIRQIC